MFHRTQSRRNGPLTPSILPSSDASAATPRGLGGGASISPHSRHYSFHLGNPRGCRTANADLRHDILNLIDELALVDQEFERVGQEALVAVTDEPSVQRVTLIIVVTVYDTAQHADEGACGAGTLSGRQRGFSAGD
jgi:hypothetical protein